MNNQLVEVSYPGAGELLSERFGYDKAGKRLTRERRTADSIIMETYRHDNCNRIKELNRKTYEQDGVTQKLKNQTMSVSNNPDAVASYIGETSYYGYDRSGNLLSDGSATYTYDGFGRTAEVRMANGNSQINRYDAEGLRAEMEENGQLVKFLFNGEKEVIAEETDDGVIRYVRGLGIISSDSESARTYYHYVSDNQGSVRLILTDTANDRRIRNSYCYDAFGESVISHEDIHNRFRFNGEQYDPVTSQYYLRARYYNPVIGRFTQEDTYYGDGLNLYEYCKNNPVLYRDPNGHDAVNQGNLYTSDMDLTIMLLNSSRGNPSAIMHFDVELNTRQKKLLQKLSDYDSSVIVNKSDVNLKDLAALTAKTGNVFAMFTRGSQRMIVRGNSNAVNINGSMAQKLYNSGFKWSGHTHPGTGLNVKFASEGDIYILNQFKQTQSVILDSRGNFNVFEMGE